MPKRLAALGVRYLLVRSAGHDNVDLPTAQRLGLRVATVPHYSPFAIAEHALALMLALNRHLRQANAQVRRADFRLDNLVGFDLHGKTVGIIGCGTIGGTLARLLHGFDCRLLGHDVAARRGAEPALRPRIRAPGCALRTVRRGFGACPAHARHPPPARCPAAGQAEAGRHAHQHRPGALLDTAAALAALDSGQLSYLGLDVYEFEKGLFFNDHSQPPPRDELLSRLLSHPNVLATGHQGFLTRDALTSIAATSLETLDCWLAGRPTPNELLAPPVAAAELAAR